MSNVGRNDPCPCNSGKKYKKCCESADKDQRSQELNPTANADYDQDSTFSVVVAMKPMPRKPQRRAPGRFARSGELPALLDEDFPGEQIAQSFMAAFRTIIRTIQAANKLDAINTILDKYDCNQPDYPQDLYETIAIPYAALRAVIDTTQASAIDRQVRNNLRGDDLELYNQLTQQRFQMWLFDADDGNDYFQTSRLHLSSIRETQLQIDGFISLADFISSSLHIAMPLEWKNYKLLFGLGTIDDPSVDMPQLIEIIVESENILKNLAQTAPNLPMEAMLNQVIEGIFLRYLLDPTPYDLDEDDYDDYECKYQNYRPSIHDVILNIFMYLNPVDPPEYEEYYVHQTFMKLLETTETRQLKILQDNIEEDYEETISYDYHDAYDDFREILPLSQIHHMIGTNTSLAVIALNKAKLQPAALLLDDDLLQKLGVSRTDDIKAVEKAVRSRDKDEIATLAKQTIKSYLRNQRMTWLLGYRPEQPTPDETIFWNSDYRYDLIMAFADPRFKAIPLTNLAVSKAIHTRMNKAFGPQATIHDLPARRDDLRRNTPGIGSVTTDAILNAVDTLFHHWPNHLARVDTSSSPQQFKQASSETSKALDDINKLFE